MHSGEHGQSAQVEAVYFSSESQVLTLLSIDRDWMLEAAKRHECTSSSVGGIVRRQASLLRSMWEISWSSMGLVSLEDG